MGQAISDSKKVINERYDPTREEQIEELSIAQRLEMYNELKEQLTELEDLEDDIEDALHGIEKEEKTFREKEEFLEHRRVTYLHELKKASSRPDIPDDEAGRASSTEATSSQGVGGGTELAVVTSDENEIQISEEEVNPIVGGEGEGVGEGEKKEEVQIVDSNIDFLENELPRIQADLALETRLLIYRKRECEEKLDLTRREIEKVEDMMKALGQDVFHLVNASSAV